ncbi:MAG: methylated-DNA--[protein]-cysteine S-methyltransferase [Phyllobacteriaceae bacterium]|nr:methylated-DNA--[protein]-cysteine S-methyltransferase [Phyllobacteriaceae bacterium]
MSNTFLTLFDTALGRCGIAWGGNGILSANFPEDTDDRTRQQLRRRAPEAQETDDIPPRIASVITAIQALMEGASEDLRDAELDMTGLGDFEQQLYGLSRQIGPGETRSYGDLARDLGDVAFSQRVGQALGRNPFPIIVPCHRVIGANGQMTGFSAPGGVETKRQLLKIEGAIERDLFDLMG